jgi:flagellar FliL protein
MSTAVAPDNAKPGKPAKAKGGLVKMLLIPLVFVAGAAAGGFGGAIGARQFGGGGGGHAEAPAPAEAAPIEYVEIDNAFTSNLADTGRYLQLRVSVSTSGGAPTVAAIARHKPALISAVLSVLGEMGEADVANRAAKDKLRDRLKAAINATLKDKGITAGIDDVFFTSLVIQ